MPLIVWRLVLLMLGSPLEQRELALRDTQEECLSLIGSMQRTGDVLPYNSGTISVGGSLTCQASYLLCLPEEPPVPAPLSCTDLCKSTFEAGGLMPVEWTNCNARCAGTPQ